MTQKAEVILLKLLLEIIQTTRMYSENKMKLLQDLEAEIENEGFDKEAL
jgi:hypothetical protein